jgi:hypothetical protein
MSSSPKSEQRKSESLQVRIEHAVGRLKSLHDGDSGFLEVVELGPDVVPALRRLLFEPEPSGLHQIRGRAAEALAALGAFDVLADFLRSRQPIADPVERLGEEVVTGAAARASARSRGSAATSPLTVVSPASWRVLGRFIAKTRSRSSSAPLAKTRCA